MNRRNVTTNVWANKINPITGQANGAATQIKAPISKAPVNQESKLVETLGNDRLIFLLGSCMVSRPTYGHVEPRVPLTRYP